MLNDHFASHAPQVDYDALGTPPGRMPHERFNDARSEPDRGNWLRADGPTPSAERHELNVRGWPGTLILIAGFAAVGVAMYIF